MLSFEERELVATLIDLQAYQLLVKVLEEEINEVSEHVLRAESTFQEQKLLALWKALRFVLLVLKDEPQNCDAIVRNEPKANLVPEELKIDFEKLREHQAKQLQLEALHRSYNQLFKKEEE